MKKWKQEELKMIDDGLTVEEIVKRTKRSYESVARAVRRRGKKIEHNITLPNILVFDIETAPLKVYTFGIFEQTIQPNQIAEDKYVISYSAKKLMSSKIFHDRVTGKESVKMDDRRVIKSLWKLLDWADIVIGHNIINFDIKQINAKFIEYGLPFPSPYQTVDTFRAIKSVSSFTSNKLDYLLGKFKMKGKEETGGMPLWIACKNGNENALKKMDEYCQNDTLVTEELYLFIRKYIKSHPNLGLYIDTDKEICPNCGSSKIKWEGYYYTPLNKFRAGRCECGANVRRKVSELSKDKRKLILK